MPTLAELQAISKAVEDQAAEAEARAANVSVGGHTWRALAEGVGQIGSAATGLLPDAVPGAKAAHDWLNQSVQESQASRGASALPVLSQRGFVPALAGAVPSVAATVGATALKRSPWTAPIVAAGLAAHPAYEQGQQAAIEEGRPDEAVGRGLQNALASGAAELVIGRAFPGFEQAVAARLRNETVQRAGQTATEAGKGAWRTAMRAAAPALSEGAEESLVQAAQGTSAKLLGADASSWSDIGRQSLEAGALGLTLGGGTHSLVAGADMAARAAGLRAPPTVVPEALPAPILPDPAQAAPIPPDPAQAAPIPPQPAPVQQVPVQPPPAAPSITQPAPDPIPAPVPPAHAVRFSPEYQAAVAPHLARMQLQQAAPEGLDPNLAQGFEVQGPQGPVASIMPTTREEIAATATDPNTPANAEALMRSYFEGKGNPKGFVQWQRGFQSPVGSLSHRRAVAFLQTVATRSAAGQTNIGQPADVPNAQAGMTARIVAGSEEGGMTPPATDDQVTATLHEMFHVAWGRLTPVERQVLAAQSQRAGASNAEEWAAYAFADYCRAVPPTAAPTSVIERIFAKIRSWFAEIGRAFGFQGRPSFEAVMQLVQGGEVFARPGPAPQTTVSPAEQAIVGHRQRVAQEAVTTAKTREEQDRAAEAKRVMTAEELGIQVAARRQSVERAQEAVTDLVDQIAAMAESPEADSDKIAKFQDKLRQARGKLHLAKRKLAHAQGKLGLRPAPDVETPVIKDAAPPGSTPPITQEDIDAVLKTLTSAIEQFKAPAAPAPQEAARATRAENLAANVRSELARPSPRFDRVDRLMQTLADAPGTPAQALTDLRADVHAAKIEAAGRGVRVRYIQYATRRNLANQLYADYQEGLRRGRESKAPERMTRAELQAEAIAYIKENGKATRVAADLTERLRKGEALNPTQQEAFLMLMNRQHLKGMAMKHGQANKIKAIEMSALMMEQRTMAGRLLAFGRDEIATPAERLAMWETMAFTPPASVRKRAFAESDPRKTKEVLAKWYEKQKKAFNIMGIKTPNFATMADDMTAYRALSQLQSLQATMPEIMFTAYLSGLFSGIGTQSLNMAGNTLLAPIMHFLVTPLRAAINDAIRGVGGKSEGIGVKDYGAFMTALVPGMVRGVGAALSSVWNGVPYLESLMGLTDVTSEWTPIKHRVLTTAGARSGGAVAGRAGALAGRAGALAGRFAGAAWELPLRTIMGVDQLFKYSAAHAMAAAVASRMAKGDEAKARSLMEDYQSEAWTEALKYARETTLNKALPPWVAKTVSFRHPTSWSGFFGALVAPVIGVPINALRLALDLGGGGILRHMGMDKDSPQFKKDEAKDNLARAISLAIIGWGVGAYLMAHTRDRDDEDDGRPILTAAGSSPITQKGKAAAEATDVGQGGAISFDGKNFFSLSNMPGGEFFGMVAALRNLHKKMKPGETMPEQVAKHWGLLAQQFAYDISNRTFMRNVADTVRVVTEIAAEPTAEGKKSFYNTRRLLLRTAAGFAPYSALQSQLAQMAGKGESDFVEKGESTYRRRPSDTAKTEGEIDVRDFVRLAAPLVTKVEPREPAVDAWGRPLVSIPERFAGSWMGKILAAPFRAQEIPGKEDRIAEIDRALYQLAEKHDWAYLPTVPAAEYTVRRNDGSSTTKTMTEEQYREFCLRAGKQAAEIALGIDQRNPDFFKTISPKSIGMVKKIFTWSRQKARHEMGLVGRDESSTSPDEVDPK